MLGTGKMGGRRPGRPANPDMDDSDRKPDDRFPTLDLATVLPPAPPTLNAHGAERWVELCGIILRKKILSPDFYPAIENICRAYDQLHEVETTLAQEGRVIYKKQKVGGVGRFSKCPEHAEFIEVADKSHPLLREWTALSAMIRAGLSDFGLTAASAKASNIKVSGGGGVPEKPSVDSRFRAGQDDFDPV